MLCLDLLKRSLYAQEDGTVPPLREELSRRRGEELKFDSFRLMPALRAGRVFLVSQSNRRSKLVPPSARIWSMIQFCRERT